MKHKNIFGELEFEIGKFFVPHRPGSDDMYHILKHETWCVTDAYDDRLWWVPLKFESWIQACSYLKANINYMV